MAVFRTYVAVARRDSDSQLGGLDSRAGGERITGDVFLGVDKATFRPSVLNAYLARYNPDATWSTPRHVHRAQLSSQKGASS